MELQILGLENNQKTGIMNQNSNRLSKFTEKKMHYSELFTLPDALMNDYLMVKLIEPDISL